MSNLQAQINSLTAHYTSQIVDLVQQAIREAVAGSISGHAAAPAKKAAPAPAKKAAKAAKAPAVKKAAKAAPAPAAKKPAPAPAAAAAPKKASRGKGEKRSPALIAKTTDALLAYVKSHAGQRIEQIAAGLKVTTKDLALPAKKLLSERKLKTKGQKRATQYFPGLETTSTREGNDTMGGATVRAEILGASLLVGCAGLVGADFDSLQHRGASAGSGGGGASGNVASGGNAGASGGTGGSVGSAGKAGIGGASGSGGVGAQGGTTGGQAGNAAGQSGTGGSQGGSGPAPAPLFCGDMSGLQAGSPWPMARYCPTRQGRSPAPRLAAVKPTWVFPTPTEVTTEPVITKDGVIVFGTQDGRLFGVTQAGSMAFVTPLGNGPMHGAAAIAADGTMYVGSGTSVYAVSPGGDVLWTFPTAGVVLSSPTVRGDGVVYVTSYDYHLYALTPGGAMAWSYAATNVIGSSPAVAPDGTIYFGSYDKKLHAVSSEGGRQMDVLRR